MKWISVKDRLPELEKIILAYVKVGMAHNYKGWNDTRPKAMITGFLSKGYYENISFYTNCECSGYERDREEFELIAWMELPKGPDAGE